ncbi:MAG: hypothetical protein Q8M01_20910 [Rubrivivax sp.]|nr:hypothetical protein [Rubrivivax sp.]
MIDRPSLTRELRRLWRASRRVVGGLLTLALVVTTWALLAGSPQRAELANDTAAAPGWGQEALADVQERMREVSPIGLANACGMGSSSCAKCHNGTRAVAPKPGKWHTDHKTVNDSCAGCHRGNPRLMKTELAHAKMVVDPRTAPENCTACHKSDDMTKLMAAYQKK